MSSTCTGNRKGGFAKAGFKAIPEVTCRGNVLLRRKLREAVQATGKRLARKAGDRKLAAQQQLTSTNVTEKTCVAKLAQARTRIHMLDLTCRYAGSGCSCAAHGRPSSLPFVFSPVPHAASREAAFEAGAWRHGEAPRNPRPAPRETGPRCKSRDPRRSRSRSTDQARSTDQDRLGFPRKTAEDAWRVGNSL